MDKTKQDSDNTWVLVPEIVFGVLFGFLLLLIIGLLIFHFWWERRQEAEADPRDKQGQYKRVQEFMKQLKEKSNSKRAASVQPHDKLDVSDLIKSLDQSQVS